MAKAPIEDEGELLRQLAKGDPAAFATVYERYQGPIYRFAWHMSGNRALAEETTQEVFLRLIAKPGKYDSAKGPLAGYLFGMARNVIHQHSAQNPPDLPLASDDLGEDLEPNGGLDILSRIGRQEMIEYLRLSVLALPAPYREAVVLCDLQELSYPEAGVILQCPPGTVASRLHRARNMLKARLAGMGCLR
jgi:RNA polymerase sigma-70 factor (ECF subfamily)